MKYNSVLQGSVSKHGTNSACLWDFGGFCCFAFLWGLGSTGVGTQGLPLAIQVCYHLSHDTSPLPYVFYRPLPRNDFHIFKQLVKIIKKRKKFYDIRKLYEIQI
jgi:hypothetical protein